MNIFSVFSWSYSNFVNEVNGSHDAQTRHEDHVICGYSLLHDVNQHIMQTQRRAYKDMLK